MTEPAEESSPPERARATDVLRAVIRQLAAATYVLVAFALVVRFVGHSSGALLALVLGLTVLVAALFARLVEGRLWTSALIGVFVAVFVVAVSTVQGGGRGRVFKFAVVESVVALAIVLAGLGGSLVGRRWRRRRPA